MEFDKLAELQMRQRILQAAREAKISLPSPLPILAEKKKSNTTIFVYGDEAKGEFITYENKPNGTYEINF